LVPPFLPPLLQSLVSPLVIGFGERGTLPRRKRSALDGISGAFSNLGAAQSWQQSASAR